MNSGVVQEEEREVLHTDEDRRMWGKKGKEWVRRKTVARPGEDLTYSRSELTAKEEVVEVYLKQCTLPSEMTIMSIYGLAGLSWVLLAASICYGRIRSSGVRSKGASVWPSRKILKMV